MRNWNMFWCHYSIFLRKFLQYLWGIETEVSYEIYDKEKEVFTVPMRNWNKFFNLIL